MTGRAPLRHAAWRRAAKLAPAVAVVACIVASYHYSLGTLLAELGQDSPLAYLGVIPVIALLLAAVFARPRPGELDIHDRYLDYIVGLPLLAMALLLLVVAPAGLSSLFWLRRLDLLSLPLFVAGAIALVFGMRALWRLRAAVGFLLLAWPYPYVLFLDHQLTWFTDVTSAAVRGALKLVPVASVLPDGDFLVWHNSGASQAFAISVSSACSGVNGGLGFLIVGGAATLVMRGRFYWKLLWLAVGTGLLFVVNVGRIVLILAAGRAWGEGFAVDVLHPAVGLVMILAATAVMLALLPRFRLALQLPRMRRRNPADDPSAPRRPAVARARVPVTLLLVATAVATLANSGMSRFELLAFGLGPPRLGPDSLVGTTTKGWSLTPSAQYAALASRYFGSHGTWARYAYVQTTSNKNLSAPAAITMDIVGSDDLGTFSTYGLEACYRFHNFALLEEASVDLGGSLTGKVVRYQLPGAQSDWLALYWEWPVRVPGSERYQRIVLSVDTSATANQLDQRSLVSLARHMVEQAAKSAPGNNAAVF